ncbi:MAG: hypothetical protein ABI208_01375 [Ginsengibacter sp.]
MKKIIPIILITMFSFSSTNLNAQCSICNKTVMQMGSKPAQGFNTGILYLMAIPYLAVGFVGYRWWRSKHEKD